MPASTSGLIVAVVLTVFLLGCNGRTVLTVAHNMTINLVCTDGIRYPIWFVNGITVGTESQCSRSSFSIGGMTVTATLTIDGSCICGTLNMHCEAYIAEERQLAFLHNTTLTIQGHLPSPENVHINETDNIEWNPPYSAMNNDVIRVYPHITQYTVYITDNYTGNSIFKTNVTETRFTFNVSNDDVCPMYQVSAWNAGGEGGLSEPVQDHTSVPHSIAAEIITAEVTVEHVVVLIYIEDVDAVCISRMPQYFVITWMTSDGSVVNETITVPHQPGQAVANFAISLPQTVDVCSLHVRISAGNSAGMSAPSEAVEVVCSGGSAGSITTITSTVAASTVASTGSGNGGNTTSIVILIGVIATIVGVIATIVGVMIVAATAGIIYCKGCRKDKSKKHDIEMKPNQAYETVTRPQPATQVHTEPCLAYEVVVHTHH